MLSFIEEGNLRAFLHEGGGPQVGEVTCGRLPHLTCKHDHIKMRDYMDRRVTPPKRVTSPTWGPPPPRKQALRIRTQGYDSKGTAYSVFSLTWPASMQIYWNKRKRSHKKRVQLLQDWFGTPTWLPFHCFVTPIWPA